MKSLNLLLFCLGVIWAYVCLGFLFGPIMSLWHIVQGENWGFTYLGLISTFILMLLLSINSILGYWIWFGWLNKFRKNKYHKVDKETFWKYSLINHITWIILLPFMFGLMGLNGQSHNPITIWLYGIQGWWYLVWPICVCILSLQQMTEPEKIAQ